MTVLLRVKRSRGATRRRPHETDPPPARAGAVPPSAPEAGPSQTPPARPARRTPPAPQDSALYTCSCGLVFTDDVSASVACPHCGETQAW